MSKDELIMNEQINKREENFFAFFLKNSKRVLLIQGIKFAY